MKSSKTIRQENYKKHLYKLVAENEEARTLKARQKVMRFLLNKEWSNLMQNMGVNTFIEDVIYLDRQIRKATEGYDTENKAIAEQEWLQENYQPTP